jgi:hypothetical protein
MRANKPKSPPNTHQHNSCAQCGEALFAPSWSEDLGEERVRYLWNCDVCGYQFETTVYLAPLKPAVAVFDAAA